jgi:hypothetical protein
MAHTHIDIIPKKRRTAYYTSDDFILKLAKTYNVLDDVKTPSEFLLNLDLDQVCVVNRVLPHTNISHFKCLAISHGVLHHYRCS